MNVYEALAAAQAEMKNPALNGYNPHFKNKFATLLDVRDAVVPVLAKHGISVSQIYELTAEGVQVLHTALVYKDAQSSIRSTVPVPAYQNPQQWSSASTYIRRVSLMAIACVVGDPDEDANEASKENGAKSNKDHSGRLDTTDVNPAFVAKGLKAFRDGMADKNDEAVLRAHEDMNTDPEAYQAVTDALTPKEKLALREAITRARGDRAQRRMASA